MVEKDQDTKNRFTISNSEEEKLFNELMGFPEDHGFGREFFSFFPMCKSESKHETNKKT